MGKTSKATASRKPSVQGMGDRPEDDKERRLEAERAREGVECKTVFFCVSECQRGSAKDPLEELIAEGWEVECCLGYSVGSHEMGDWCEMAMAVLSRRIGE